MTNLNIYMFDYLTFFPIPNCDFFLCLFYIAKIVTFPPDFITGHHPQHRETMENYLTFSLHGIKKIGKMQGKRREFICLRS